MLAPLRITERPVGDTLLMELSGHLVFDDGDRVLRERVHDVVAAGSRHILLDLHNVTYVDSGGVGALVEMYLHVTRLGGRLAIVRPGPCAQRVLDITHLWSEIEIFDDEETAIRGIHMPSGAHKS